MGGRFPWWEPYPGGSHSLAGAIPLAGPFPLAGASPWWEPFPWGGQSLGGALGGIHSGTKHGNSLAQRAVTLS